MFDGWYYERWATRVESCPPDIQTAMKLFGYLNVCGIRGAFTLIITIFWHLKYTILVVFSWNIWLALFSLGLFVFYFPSVVECSRSVLLVVGLRRLFDPHTWPRMVCGFFRAISSSRYSPVGSAWVVFIRVVLRVSCGSVICGVIRATFVSSWQSAIPVAVIVWWIWVRTLRTLAVGGGYI